MLKRRFVIAIVFILISFAYSTAQTFLVLDVTRIAGFKRIKYYAGDEIRFKDGSSGKRYKGTIVGFRDSLILFAGKEVNIKDIKIIYRNNENFVTRGLGRLCIAFGIMFVSLDTFNNITNKRPTIVDSRAVEESAAFVASGLILRNMMKHRYKIGKRRTIKIMDLSFK